MYFDKRGTGPAVVLIHGLGASSFSWRETANILSPDFTTYAVDLLGFGQSPAPNGFAFTMEAQAQAVAKMMGDEGLSEAAVIGHSMGGGVALYLADWASKGNLPSLSKMVLVSAVASPPDATFGGGDDAFQGLNDMPGFKLPAAVSRKLAEKILDFACVAPITSAQIDGYAAGLSTTDQVRAFRSHAKTLGAISFPPAKLDAIKTETLVIWGEQDTFILKPVGEKLASDLGKGSLTAIDQCGHIPQEEQAAKTNAAISAFLA